MLGPDDLVLCSGTLIEARLAEKVDAAAAAGFQAISLWPDDVERARAAGLSDADIRDLIRDRGLLVAELDPLLSWLQRGGSIGDAAAQGAAALLGRGEAEFHRIADAIGGTLLNCPHPFPGDVDRDRAAEAFAGVCDRAAEHGLAAAIEFLPWTGIPDVATAADIALRAGRANGGIMLDTWHFFRGPSTDEQLRAIPGALIRGVQINGAPAEPAGDLMLESMNGRLLPDEGAIDVAGILRILDEIGSTAPIGVEVFSAGLKARPSEETARRCATAAREVIGRARG